jgi:hypothetical protein
MSNGARRASEPGKDVGGELSKRVAVAQVGYDRRVVYDGTTARNWTREVGGGQPRGAVGQLDTWSAPGNSRSWAGLH